MLSDHNARFNFNLRLRLIEDSYQLTHCLDIFFDIRHDQSVAASINLDRAATRKATRDDRQQALVAASTRGITAGATTETQVSGTTREGAGCAGSLGQCARSASVVQANELGHERRSIEPRIVNYFLRFRFLVQNPVSCYARVVPIV